MKRTIIFIAIAALLTGCYTEQQYSAPPRTAQGKYIFDITETPLKSVAMIVCKSLVFDKWVSATTAEEKLTLLTNNMWLRDKNIIRVDSANWNLSSTNGGWSFYLQDTLSLSQIGAKWVVYFNEDNIYGEATISRTTSNKIRIALNSFAATTLKPDLGLESFQFDISGDSLFYDIANAMKFAMSGNMALREGITYTPTNITASITEPVWCTIQHIGAGKSSRLRFEEGKLTLKAINGSKSRTVFANIVRAGETAALYISLDGITELWSYTQESRLDY